MFRDGYVFFQDGTSSHTLKVTEEWCKAHNAKFCEKDILPHSSPDVKPMGFAIWVILEGDVCVALHGSAAALKRIQGAALSNFYEDTLRR